MSAVLQDIVARRRVGVAKAQATTPLEVLKQRCEKMERPRNFFQAVVDERNRAQTRVIAEIKQRSPSAGVIRENFDPAAIARQYEAAGAAAISCLTEEEHFGGHLGYIQIIREAVALPVLRKDFIVEEYQIWESRAAGADAILLIAEILPEANLMDMMILAQRLGMTTLVEAHDVENLFKVKRHVGFPHTRYSLLGINNRDLRTMETDLAHTFRMVELLDDTSVIVSESGIRDAGDLVRLRRHGINIVLIGEHLMRQPDPGEALRQLLTANQAP